jgi:hypothetical protein
MDRGLRTWWHGRLFYLRADALAVRRRVGALMDVEMIYLLLVAVALALLGWVAGWLIRTWWCQCSI